MTPDFSPRMLALFLEARVVARMCWRGEDRREAVKRFTRETAKVARVAQRTIENARRGLVHDGAKRALIWGALGVVPGDFGVLLTDDGGQECAFPEIC